MRLNIRQKHLLFILAVIAIIYAGIVGFILSSTLSSMKDEAEQLTKKEAQLGASAMLDLFDAEFTLVSAMAQSMGIYRSMSEEDWQRHFTNMLVEVKTAHPQIFSLWAAVELSAYVPGHVGPGRRQLAAWYERGQLKVANAVKGVAGDSENYALVRSSEHGCLWEPYLDKADGVAERIMMVSFVAPIRDAKGGFAGVVGSDIGLTQLQKLVESINPVEGSLGFVVSHGGIIAAHPNAELINTTLENAFPEEVEEHDLYRRVAKGEEYSYVRTDNSGRKYLTFYAPVDVGQLNTPWSLVIQVPIDIIHAKPNHIGILALVLSIVGIFIIIVDILLVSNSISGPIAQMTQSLNRLADGEMSSELMLTLHTGDELEEMSQALNTSLQGLNSKAQFAGAIGEGLYDTELDLLSERDALGKSLLQMRDSLQRATQEEAARRHEAQIAAWATAGQAKLGELLRQHSDDLQHLCDDVVGELVRYLGANQGALFLLSDAPQDDDAPRRYDLMAAYAWDRRKHVRRTVEEGEGLVGACALERAPIYMTDVPPDYITIGSGLGQANPRCILLVPLLSDEQVVGVLELASFRPLEPHEVEFVERACAGVAGTVIGVRMNARTRELLEQSQMQAEEMRAQEEEMRQNLEELQATQEEVARKTEESEGLVNAIQGSSFVVEYDLNGNVTDINDAYLRLTGLTRADVIGQHHSDRLHMSAEQQANYTKFWDDLRAGHTRKQRLAVEAHGYTANLLEVYIPVKNAYGEIKRIMKLAFEFNEFAG